MNWVVNNFIASPKLYPHLNVKHVSIDWKDIKQFAVAASFVSDYDCKHEMPYWYIIKDTPFEIDAVKSKRRYEIKKGLSNFNVELLNKCQLICNINGGGSV